MYQNGENARRDLKRKLPQMDRGHEPRSYNTNSTPYDRNALPPGGFYFILFYVIQSKIWLINFVNCFVVSKIESCIVILEFKYTN
jgi:hypothetical protein